MRRTEHPGPGHPILFCFIRTPTQWNACVKEYALLAVIGITVTVCAGCGPGDEDPVGSLPAPHDAALSV